MPKNQNCDGHKSKSFDTSNVAGYFAYKINGALDKKKREQRRLKFGGLNKIHLWRRISSTKDITHPGKQTKF